MPSNLGLGSPILELGDPNQVFLHSNLGLAGTILRLGGPSQVFMPSNLGLARLEGLQS